MSKRLSTVEVLQALDELDVYDANEWFDLMRRVKRNLSREEFDMSWNEFQAFKALKRLN